MTFADLIKNRLRKRHHQLLFFNGYFTIIHPQAYLVFNIGPVLMQLLQKYEFIVRSMTDIITVALYEMITYRLKLFAIETLQPKTEKYFGLGYGCKTVINIKFGQHDIVHFRFN